MKRFWVRLNNWDKQAVTTALEQGAEAIVLPSELTEKVKELGVIKTVAEKNADLLLGKDVAEIEIKSKEDEVEAAKLSGKKAVIVKTSDWSIIPLENLVAQTDNIIAEVRNAAEAKTALEVLEKGVAGILLNSSNMQEIVDVGKMLAFSNEKLPLVKVKISSINPVGSGDRVCIDTCTNMKNGQGMLIGNSSNGFLLINSESVENPYVEARPFRVNAGAVHAYISNVDGKTNYLNELCSGMPVRIVDFEGNTETAVVGRVKVEKRPLMLVEGRADGKKISLVLQNAETIRLVKPNGKTISIVELKQGDEVLGFVEESGRHFGMKIKEKIEEK